MEIETLKKFDVLKINNHKYYVARIFDKHQTQSLDLVKIDGTQMVPRFRLYINETGKKQFLQHVGFYEDGCHKHIEIKIKTIKLTKQKKD